MSSEEQHRQWHPSVALDAFVISIKVDLADIVSMTKTPKFVLFDIDTVKRAVGWGSYIEEVVNMLSTEWQRDMLAQALAFNSCVDPHKLTLSRLGQARRWVLFSMLGSPFLAYHQKPEELVGWIMTEYAGLPDKNAPPNPSRSEANDTGCFSAFSIDATSIMRSCANTAAMSHGHSALLACMGRGAAPDCSGKPARCAKRASCLSSSEAFDSFAGLAETPNAEGTFPEDGEGSRPLSVYESRPSSVYETSAATAQKRAYASNCCSVLLSKYFRSESGRVNHGQSDEATIFIAEMTALARTDTMVMEVMCLMLLDPSLRRTVYIEGRDVKGGCIQEPPQAPDSHNQHGSMLASPVSKLLEQVLGLKSDARLWSLDDWLLVEVSHHHDSFADAYLAHVLDDLREMVQNELDEGTAKYWVDYRIEDRLAAVCSRSDRLAALCRSALQQSTLAQSLS